jgi:hypothetical protein
MHKWEYKNGYFIPSTSILIFSGLLIVSCKGSKSDLGSNSSEGKLTRNTTSDVPKAYMKFRSFQNTDSTWGYTIFMNSKPYLHYSSIQSGNAGFKSRKDAETVAGYIVKLIENGNLSPKLNKETIDSLELIMK